MSPSERHPLRPHRVAPPRIELEIDGTVELRGDALGLTFEVRGDVEMIALAAPSSRPSRRNRLWEETCFEAFVAAADGTAYLEVNLSPSGDWALWAFDGYREGMRAAPSERPPVVRVAASASELHVAAALPLGAVCALLAAAPARIGLAAVIAEVDGHRSYWACGHAADRPDFHRSEAWSIAVLPGGSGVTRSRA